MNQESLLSDPKVVSAVIGALIVFIAPTIRDFLITRKTKRNLLKILTIDVKSRINKINDIRIPLQHAINRAKGDDKYVPWVFYNEGLEDHIDWKDEKWLIPKDLISEIVEFYSHTKSLINFIETINSEKSDKLSHDRKINMLEELQCDFTKSYMEGFTLLKLLQSRQ